MKIANIEIDEKADLSLDDAARVIASLRQIIFYDKATNPHGIVGQEEMIHFLIIGLITGNHILLEGFPGLAKTIACRMAGGALGLQFNRVQFVPDMMPSDLLGSVRLAVDGTVTRQRWVAGKVFCNVLLADEINRASSKVQAALLEAMGEQQVSVIDQETKLVRTAEETEALKELAAKNEPIFGKRINLSSRSNLTFSVIATMNPIEMEGTYPLGEAQLDRFMAKVIVSYPTMDDLKLIQTHEVRCPEEPFRAEVSLFLARLRELLTAGRASVASDSDGRRIGKQALVDDFPKIARQIRWLTWFSHARPLGGGADDAGGWTSDGGDAAASIQARTVRHELRQWARGEDPEKKAFAASLIEALSSDAYPGVVSGASPRGLARLTEAVMAHALLHGRLNHQGQIAPVQEDLWKVAKPILRHRIRLSSAATAANRSSDEAIDALLMALKAANEASPV